MSDCVCLDGGWDGDGEAPEFYSAAWRKARTAHTCCECRRPILPGVQYYRVTGKWEGEVSTSCFCAECHDIGETLYCGGRAFGTLWADVEEQLFAEGLMNSACLDKLTTVESKQYLQHRWWAWVEKHTT